MDISTLIKDFKTYDELKIFCNSQFNQILNLSKKNRELEEKVKELEKSPKVNNYPALTKLSQIEESTSNAQFFVADDAKTIAQVQLKMLKEQAFDRELTYEETKKLEIFNKVLNVQASEKDKPLKANAKVLDEKELLELVTNE